MNHLEKLLNGQKVEWKRLGEVAEIKKGKQLNKTELKDQGKYPAYNGGKTHSGWTDNYNVESDTVIISQGGASAGFVNFITMPFWANAHCYYLLPCIQILNNRYLYHFLKLNEKTFMDNQHGAGIPALSQTKLSSFKIPIPPLSVQKEIVRILDAFTALSSELSSELNLRKKQYQYYRDLLLSEDELAKVGFEWKRLGDVAIKISSGGTPKTGIDKYYSGNIPWLRTQEVNFGEIWDTGIKITEEGVKNSSAKWIPKDCVIVAMYGATVGRVAINKIPMTTNQACANIQADESILNYRYLFYYLSSQYEYIKSLGTGSQTNINAQIIKGLQIPVPPLEHQAKIVAILDKFEALCQSISEGLPREMELRRKQYEYYRELLLGFDPAP